MRRVTDGVSCELTAPVGERQLGDPVSACPQSADKDAKRGVLRAGEMVSASGRALGDGNMTDGRRADIGGHEIERKIDVGSETCVGDEPDQRGHLGRGAPRAGTQAADYVQRPVDGDRQARAARRPQELLCHVFCLDIPHAQQIGVRQRGLLGHLPGTRQAEAREDRGGGHIVHRYAPVEAGQSDHLAGARHVGGPQLLIGIDEVHLCARMVDNVDAAGQVTECRG